MTLRFRFAALAAAIVLGVACSHDNGPIVPTTPSKFNLKIATSPTSVAELDQDDSVQVFVTITDVDTKLVVPNPDLTYTFDDKVLALSNTSTSDSLGRFGGHAFVHALATPATVSTTLKVSFKNVNKDSTLTATVPIKVVPDPAASVAITQAVINGADSPTTVNDATPLALQWDATNGGDEAALSATAVGVLSDTIPLRPVAWSSLDPTVVAVDSTGLATAMAVGSTKLVAKVDSIADSVTVNVTARP
ncbi:MAG TPA: hypothetical protein VFW98_07980 [Gemmatimonadaceae bacterium]|nr:hypothetical protein [Gemmatimonadaceae bacterium]